MHQNFENQLSSSQTIDNHSTSNMGTQHDGLQCSASQDIVISFLSRALPPITKCAEYLKVGHALGQEELRRRHMEFYAVSFINYDNFGLT